MTTKTEWKIDADAHISEPAGTFVDRVPASMKDDVPYVATGANGSLHWFLRGEPFYPLGAAAHGAGWPEPLPSAPANYEEMHPGAYDANERLKYLDQAGIWAQVLYPNVAGFGSQNFLELGDPDVMLACVRAYNDFQTDWTSANPDRLLPVAAMPFWDVEASVAEVQRCAEMGHRGILFTGEPHRFGLPVLGSREWDPFWSAAADTELPISFHIGGGDPQLSAKLEERVKTTGFPAASTYTTIDMYLGNGLQIADLLLSGVLPRFPTVKFISVESGVGFVPFLLEALDYTFAACGGTSSEFPEPPSHYFKQQVFACWFFEELQPQSMIDSIGAGNILFETDFPHALCLFGDAVEQRVTSSLSDVSDDVRRKILWQNSADLYKVAEPA